MKKAWYWFIKILSQVSKFIIVVIIFFTLSYVFLANFPGSIIAQTCAEQYSQVLDMGPLSSFDVDDAVMDFVEAHIHLGMSRLEVMSALPEIEHQDYFPPYWEHGLIEIYQCPTYFFIYSAEFDGDELIRIERDDVIIERSFLWYLH